MNLVGHGVGVSERNGNGGCYNCCCLGQNQYCGHPFYSCHVLFISLTDWLTPFQAPLNTLRSIAPLRLWGQVGWNPEVDEKGVFGCRCRVITTLKTRVALAHPLHPHSHHPRFCSTFNPSCFSSLQFLSLSLFFLLDFIYNEIFSLFLYMLLYLYMPWIVEVYFVHVDVYWW